MPEPVCLWSGPRNVSTALMYSFAQRSDIRVIDEPLYGHYLRVSGAVHPGGADVMAAMNCNGDAVIGELMAEAEHERLFVKHMAHHLVELDLDFLRQSRNVLLVRDPREMLPSLTIQVPHAELDDTGLKRQWQLFEQLCGYGQQPAVLDSRELLLDPEGVLLQLCDHLGLEFDHAMLSWPARARPEDGVWAPHWYHAVHQSTGFAPYEPKQEFPALLLPLLEECRPWYDKLFEHAIRARSQEN
ncbi:MAG: sulfotransferase family protein [Pseudomonadota bacterium]